MHCTKLISSCIACSTLYTVQKRRKKTYMYISHSKVSKVSSYATQDAMHIPARVTKWVDTNSCVHPFSQPWSSAYCTYWSLWLPWSKHCTASKMNKLFFTARKPCHKAPLGSDVWSVQTLQTNEILNTSKMVRWIKSKASEHLVQLVATTSNDARWQSTWTFTSWAWNAATRKNRPRQKHA